jgi:hypothetical protein
MALCEKELPAGSTRRSTRHLLSEESRDGTAQAVGRAKATWCSADGRQYLVRQGGTELIVRLIDGDYPDYEQVVPKEKRQDRNHLARQAVFRVGPSVDHGPPNSTRGIKSAWAAARWKSVALNPNLGEAVSGAGLFTKARYGIRFNARVPSRCVGVLTTRTSFSKWPTGCRLLDQTPRVQGYRTVGYADRLE